MPYSVAHPAAAGFARQRNSCGEKHVYKPSVWLPGLLAVGNAYGELFALQCEAMIVGRMMHVIFRLPQLIVCGCVSMWVCELGEHENDPTICRHLRDPGDFDSAENPAQTTHTPTYSHTHTQNRALTTLRHVGYAMRIGYNAESSTVTCA